MDRSLSKQIFEKAQSILPGGVNSPARSFRAVETPPIVAASGRGAYLYDVDGNRYVDYLMSWGAAILGHAHPRVVDAIRRAASRGVSFGLTTEAECALAEIIRQAFPSMERVRLVNSGTEAVMSAVRLARGFFAQSRDKVLMFEGCYHGHSDGLLARAGSGLASLSIPASRGVPRAFAAETLLARYNDLDSVEEHFRRHGDSIGCVLVEPVAANMGVVPPVKGFLEGLRALCDKSGALLIFDEVITGFRLSWGGAQGLFGVRPDMTTLGKIIGGGLPVGAFGGRRGVMDKLAPLGDVYQAGTLSGNPVVASAGAAVLEILRETDPYAELERRAERLSRGISSAAKRARVPLHVSRVGSMFTCFFSDEQVRDYETARQSNTQRYGSFFRHLLEAGVALPCGRGTREEGTTIERVLLPPSQFEAGFVSTAHSDDDIARTLSAISDCGVRIAQSRIRGTTEDDGRLDHARSFHVEEVSVDAQLAVEQGHTAGDDVPRAQELSHLNLGLVVSQTQERNLLLREDLL